MKTWPDKNARSVTSFILKPQQEMSRESEDVTHMLANMICKPKSMFLYQREMFIRRKKSSKMSLFTISIWPMPSHRAVMISWAWWDKLWSQRKQKSLINLEVKSTKSLIDILTRVLQSLFRASSLSIKSICWISNVLHSWTEPLNQL